MRACALALSTLLAACTGAEGTISISVTSAPGSDLLSRVERVEAHLTNPEKRFVGERDSDGELKLAIDIEADGEGGEVVLRGFDADGELIAVGRSAPLPWGAITADIRVFMAEPLSMALSPSELVVPRSHVGSAPGSFGVFFAGGRNQDGARREVEAYSVLLHETQLGPAMPGALSEVALARGSTSFLYMVGGRDSEGQVRADSYAFDTNSGRFNPITISSVHARAGAQIAPVGLDLYLVSGDPGLSLDGLRTIAQAAPNDTALDGPVVSLRVNDAVQAIFGGLGVESGATLFDDGELQSLEAPAELLREAHAVANLSQEDAVFFAGAIEGALRTDAVIYRGATGSFEIRELLSEGRLHPAVAISDRYLVVAGGEDISGNAIGTVEVFTLPDLRPIATPALTIPRRGATAQAMSNGQILIAGGIDSDGNPTASIELFTPNEDAPDDT